MKPALLYMKDDLMKAVEAFVIGQCFLWNQHYKQFRADDQEFFLFCMRTSDKIYKYVLGERRTADYGFSDMECELALKAHRIFGVHMINIYKRDIQQLCEFDNGQEVERVQGLLNVVEGRG